MQFIPPLSSNISCEVIEESCEFIKKILRIEINSYWGN